jgi:hypothetical protein
LPCTAVAAETSPPVIVKINTAFDLLLGIFWILITEKQSPATPAPFLDNVGSLVELCSDI